MYKIVIEEIERGELFATLFKKKRLWFLKWFVRADWFYHKDIAHVHWQVERWKKQHAVLWIDDRTKIKSI